MHDKLKTYFTRYSGTVYIMLAIFIIACGWFIFGGGNDSDYSRSIDHLERAKDQQRESLDINKTVEASVERSAQLNQQASERISRAQEYQQQAITRIDESAITRIDESASRLDEAEKLLTRNEQLIERVEQGYQAKSPNGTATAQTAQHVGNN